MCVHPESTMSMSFSVARYPLIDSNASSSDSVLLIAILLAAVFFLQTCVVVEAVVAKTHDDGICNQPICV